MSSEANSVYVAEDEPLARAALVSMLRALPEWALVGEADNGQQAFDDCRRLAPDLLLTDIRMPLLDGLDLAAALRDACPRTLTIFITAHDQHAVDAFRVAAVDYLLKPITTTGLHACLARAKTQLRQREALTKVEGRQRYLDALLVRSVGRVDVVRLADVLAFRATGNYIEVLTDPRTYLHRQTLKTLVEQLDPAVFVQVHRTAIVACRRVRAIERDGVAATIALDNGLRLPVSARFLPELERVLST